MYRFRKTTTTRPSKQNKLLQIKLKQFDQRFDQHKRVVKEEWIKSDSCVESKGEEKKELKKIECDGASYTLINIVTSKIILKIK